MRIVDLITARLGVHLRARVCVCVLVFLTCTYLRKQDRGRKGTCEPCQSSSYQNDKKLQSLVFTRKRDPKGWTMGLEVFFRLRMEREGLEGKGRDKVLVLLEKPNRSVTLLVVQDNKIEL